MVRTRSPQFDDAHARRWQDPAAAADYRHRDGYLAEAFDLLRQFASVERPVVLDLGCGTGNLARGIAPWAARVDAVDLSAEMIAEGRRLSGGDAVNIRWQHAPAETCTLDGPYDLVAAGASMHWMDYEVVLPRLAGVLRPGGFLAVVSSWQRDTYAWDAEEKAIIARHTTAPDVVPFEMIPVWEAAGLFRQAGEFTTTPVEVAKSVADYVAGWHANSHLTRAHIDSEAFDRDLLAVLAVYCPDGVVRRNVVTHVLWGSPLSRPNP
ncbi:MAG: class I SAM-dependent methyltransferase [Dehalococcoidia bacterium]